jgi:hypothetical protein
MRRWHEQADITGNLDTVALPGGDDLTVHFQAARSLREKFDVCGAQRGGMP